MEYLFPDPEVKRMSPNNTRLLNISAELYPEGKLLQITLDMTPFQQRPYLDLVLFDSADNVVASTSVIEPAASNLELTLHLQGGAHIIANDFGNITRGKYKLLTTLSYPDLGEIDRRVLFINISPITE